MVKIFRNLKRAYEDGNDLEAREAMLIASYKAGLAFNHTGVGYVHAIATQWAASITPRTGSRTRSSCRLFWRTTARQSIPSLRILRRLRRETTGSDAEKANAFIAAIRQMNREMGLPTGFDFIEQKDFPQIIKWRWQRATEPIPCR